MFWKLQIKSLDDTLNICNLFVDIGNAPKMHDPPISFKLPFVPMERGFYPHSITNALSIGHHGVETSDFHFLEVYLLLFGADICPLMHPMDGTFIPMTYPI